MKLIIASFVVGAFTAAVGVETYNITQIHHARQLQNGTSVIAPKLSSKSKVRGGSGRVINLTSIKLTSRQLAVLAYAKKVAIEDGNPSPETFQALLFQETKAGGMKSFRVAGHDMGLATNKRYYGIGQVKLSAAKDVLKRYPSLNRFSETGTFKTDEEIIANLILNDEFNIRISSKYLLMASPSSDMEVKVTSYNQGAAGAKRVDPGTWHYNVGVRAHKINVIAPANRALPSNRRDADKSNMSGPVFVSMLD